MNAARVLLYAVCFSIFGGLAPAFAALGERGQAAPAATGKTPTAARLAVARSAATALYQSQETVLPSGTTVFEFMNLQGVVFAVAWQGPTLPDLKELLGTHFTAFKSTTDDARAKGQRRSAVNLRSDSLVLRSAGRMRAFEGFAYSPGLVPAGVNIDEILP